MFPLHRIYFYWTRSCLKVFHALFCRESVSAAIMRCFCHKCRIYALFCRKCRDYTLFWVEFTQNLAEILSLFKLYNNLGKVAVRVKLWLIIYCGHLVEWIVKQKNQVSTSQNLFLLDKVLPESGSGAFFVVNLLMLQLRVFLGRKCRIYALFFVANIAITRFLGWNFWQKFVRNSQKYSEFWQKF